MDGEGRRTRSFQIMNGMPDRAGAHTRRAWWVLQQRGRREGTPDR